MHAKFPPPPALVTGSQTSAPREITTMDITKYLGKAFLKVDDVKISGPTQVVIEDVVEGQYGKLNLIFDDGTRLGLNTTNTRALAKAYGTDDDLWIG